MNELIGRQAAIDVVTKHYRAFDNDLLELIAYELGQLPSAQPERPKGEWIPQDHNKSNDFATTLVYYFPKCSECGHSGDSAFAFCPWCGADMRG